MGRFRLLGKRCPNDNSLFSLGKGNRPRQKRPAERVQPTATNGKAGAGFIIKTARKQFYHPYRSCTNAIQTVTPIHATEYTVTFFQFGFGFGFVSPTRVRGSQYFFPAFGYRSKNQCRIHLLNRRQRCLYKAKGTELTISPKNALKMSVLALLKEKAYFSLSSRDLCFWRKGSRGKLHICGLAGSHDVYPYA